MWHLTDKKYWNVSVFIHASYPGSQVAEGLEEEEEVMVVRLIKKEKDWD